MNEHENRGLELIVSQQPGDAIIRNFTEVKEILQQELIRYQNIVYSEDQYKLAKDDKKDLTRLRKAIDDQRKSVKKACMAPYEALEPQFKELIALVDEPLLLIEAFISNADNQARAQRRKEIHQFYQSVANGLGDLKDVLFDSPAFYDNKWENKSTGIKVWQDSVREKVRKASSDLSTLQSAGGSDAPALIDHYLQTMDMTSVREYKVQLEATREQSGMPVITGQDEDKTMGWKLLRISGTAMQMAQLQDWLDLNGMEWEEEADGMPKDLHELAKPDFDSFVAFDIETSGTFGAAQGDGPAEITEIGAVKVINGKVVDFQDWLCNPGRKIVPWVSKMTHITDEMVQDQPPVSEQIKAFSEYVGDLPVVGHNIKSSDLRYIRKAASRAGIPIEWLYFDTYLLARSMKERYGWDNVKLENLSQQFGIEQPEAHRAWCDAKTNVEVFFKLKELANENKIENRELM